MGWRFRKSVRIARGVRVNIGKRGVTSVSLGGRYSRVNVSRRGVRQSFSLPGTGLSYSRRIGGAAATGCGGCLLTVVGLAAALTLLAWRPDRPAARDR